MSRRDYNSYAATTRSTATRLMTRVDAASDPGRIGSDQVRGVRFEGELVVLTPPPRDGRRRTGIPRADLAEAFRPNRTAGVPPALLRRRAGRPRLSSAAQRPMP